jgi:hypothetical protein
MGKSEVKATLCPKCSYEHVIVPMFKLKKEQYFCLLCRTTFEKRVNGKTIFLPVKTESQVNVEFEPDFEV